MPKKLIAKQKTAKKSGKHAPANGATVGVTGKKPLEISELLAALSNPAPKVRASSLVEIREKFRDSRGDVPPPEVLQRIVASLHDRDANVRESAYWAANVMATFRREVRGATLPFLVSALEESDRESLDDVLKTLRDVVERANSAERAPVRERALTALTKHLDRYSGAEAFLSFNPGVSEPLLAMIASPSQIIRKRLAEVLCLAAIDGQETSRSQATDALLRLAEDTDATVANAALGALGAAAQKAAPPQVERIVRTLTASLARWKKRDPLGRNKTCRLTALSQLREVGAVARGASPALLSVLSNDEDEKVRQAALESIGALAGADDDIAIQIADIGRTDPSKEVRHGCAELLRVWEKDRATLRPLVEKVEEIEGRPRSFYVLRISVEPGGARRHDTYVYRAWEHIRSILSQLLLSASEEARAQEAYLSVSYGETLELSAVERGVVSKTIDLCPFIEVSLKRGPWVALSDEKNLAKQFGEADEEVYFGAKWSFRIDWEGIEKATPRLEGELFAPNDGAAWVSGLCARPIKMKYGYTDGEFGNQLPPIEAFVDPDPQ